MSRMLPPFMNPFPSCYATYMKAGGYLHVIHYKFKLHCDWARLLFCGANAMRFLF
jgi:hypothetical protein